MTRDNMDKTLQKEFMTLLFGNADCYIEFRLIKSKEVVQQFYHRNEIDWQDIMTRNAGGFNVFYSICGRSSKSGKKDAVRLVPAFWADIDSEIDAEIICDWLHRELPNELFYPSYVIATGHGVHAYWFLDKPILINSADDIVKVEGYLAGLANLLKSDRVFDLSRMMRLPETINWKYPDKPVPCRIIRCDNILENDVTRARRFSINDFAPYRTQPQSVKTQDIKFSKELPQVDVASLRVPDSIKRLITDPPPKGERSQAVFTVVKAMQKAGYTPSEVVAVLMSNPIGDRYDEA